MGKKILECHKAKPGKSTGPTTLLIIYIVFCLFIFSTGKAFFN